MTHLRRAPSVPMMVAMGRSMLAVLVFAVGCSAETGRSGYAVSEGEPVNRPAEVTPGAPTEPTCVPVTCDAEVSSASLAYFAAAGCSEAARVVPIAPNDPVAYGTLCERLLDGTTSVWVTAGRAPEPAMVWAGSGCEQKPSMLDGFEWWTVVQIDACE